jgi:hypothetical protein
MRARSDRLLPFVCLLFAVTAGLLCHDAAPAYGGAPDQTAVAKVCDCGDACPCSLNGTACHCRVTVAGRAGLTAIQPLATPTARQANPRELRLHGRVAPVNKQSAPPAKANPKQQQNLLVKTMTPRPSSYAIL